MADYQFTVTQAGIICVDANSEEEAREKLEKWIHHFYVVTDRGEQPANDSWELTGDVEIVSEGDY